jgi:hypothetical protein
MMDSISAGSKPNAVSKYSKRDDNIPIIHKY